MKKERHTAKLQPGEVLHFDTTPIEPTFNLVSRDILAPEIVEAWADRLAAIGGNAKKAANARAIAMQMRAWQAEHGCKVPD